MSAVIETVSIEDVYPLVDEFGNDLARRDYTLKENQAYVQELARSMRSKGIPDEMVTLVRDGGIYRIKAGNSRIMAMKELGTKTFPAIVEDESTLQAVLETVVRTNTKKKYEAVEESRFIRQLSMFGDDEYVSEVSGMEAENVAKVRRAVKVVQDAADDMSLLRLIAIGENADDPEAVEALTNCAEREYLTIAKRFEERRKKGRKASALASELEAMGIPIAESADGYDLVANVNKAAMVPGNLPDGCVAMRHHIPGFFMILKPAADDGQAAEPGQAGQREERDGARAEAEAMAILYAEGTERRRAWLSEQLQAQSLLPALSRLVEKSESRHAPLVKAFLEATGASRLNVGQSEIVLLFESMNDASGRGILDAAGRPRTKACSNYTDLLDAMEADGYEPSEDEQGIYQKAKDHLEAVNE